ncbi:hypothetical protein EMIHUDRAFT_244000 [Emiliania huxleyi CCMP1516]|uniref:Uncharacterized protein n=2 Tax=Emiliania huxleyi TaxID=2903 RepID=A0A0D3J220_EMIH1|nr:hypothetical protein EMIHUDRAFT_244000 [Emiliania huxleyi CCMP1516]EOD17555.1 hypothetical protein EMIHUDRAFT_244000 [Emiliania huxleyi CCMP1516]|eukprot:XP_005769984.1 hypothetical protein EMIHUDRAFT_244000 [Emiliania huxleyi CCMP1516]
MPYIASSGQEFRLDGPQPRRRSDASVGLLLAIALIICVGGAYLGMRMPELLHMALLLLPPAALCSFACCCRAAEAASNEAARERCAACGVDRKGAWAARQSWRERAAFFGSAAEPHPLVAVCDAGRRSVAFVSLRPDGARLERSAPVDGAPCGICSAPWGGEPAFAVTVQGEDETGQPLPGVANPSHRVVLVGLRSGRVTPAGGNDGSAMLSYPNGLCALPPTWHAWSAAPRLDRPARLLACTDWNHSRVVLWGVDDPAGAARYLARGDGGGGIDAGGFSRPSDIVHFFAAGSNRGEVAPCGCLRQARRGRPLDRPSGVAVLRPPECTSSGVFLLVAEAGAMCVSVFRVARRDGGEPVCTHVASLCDELLGTGRHQPELGLWSWLSVACSRAGDIWVTDADNGCVYLV